MAFAACTISVSFLVLKPIWPRPLLDLNQKIMSKPFRRRNYWYYKKSIVQAAKKIKKSNQYSKEEFDALKERQLLPSQNLVRETEGSNWNTDPDFNQRLRSIKRSGLEKKKAEEEKKYQPIDYDAPVTNSEGTSIGLGAKIGIGIAVVAFGLVFAFGDFIPSAREKNVEKKELTAEEKAAIQTQLQKFEAALKTSPENIEALEGAAVAHAELGEYNDAISLLQRLTEKTPKDSNAFTLLGDVRYALEDYDESALAYRNALKVASELSLQTVRGLTNALLAAQKPDEAVQELLAIKHQLSVEPERQEPEDAKSGEGLEQMYEQFPEQVDAVQINLLLGKSYSDWGHIGDALTVYDEMIAKYPEDFRGYLAKGILLKNNGKIGDAERMFIQARYFAPASAKSLVDEYSGSR